MSDFETELARADRRIAWTLVLGRAFVVALVLGVGGWAAVTRLDSAVVTSGRIVLEGNQKDVQHEDGGTVVALHVAEGQEVRAGDLLLELSADEIRDRADMFGRTAVDLWVNTLRLRAERDGAQTLAIPARLEDMEVPEAMRDAQVTLFEARRKAHRDTMHQLQERIAQNGALIEGLAAQRAARADEAGVVARQLEIQQELVARGSSAALSVVPIQRELYSLKAEVARLDAEIARTRSIVSELELQLTQTVETRLARVLDELTQREATLVEALQNRRSMLAEVARRQVRAPVSGRVLELAVHTVGGVLAPGATAMKIVPRDARPIVEARIAPADIDLVAVGQSSELQFSAYDVNDQPDIFGQVRTVSADAVVDEATGERHYSVQVAVDEDELAKLGRPVLAGMPVEVFILNQPRTLLQYIVEPLQKQLARAFRES